MQNVFRKVEQGLSGLFNGEEHSHTHGGACTGSHPEEHNSNRFQSFAPQTVGHAKWYVDGCSYFWAVSEALARAKHSVYILDWWLSPELYLRRPPSKNEQYRLDNMLKAAAERGVQVRIIVYKEVPQALTLNSAHTKHSLEALHENIRVFRHPDHLPSGHDFQADVHSAFQNLNLRTFDLAKMGKDTLQTLYGTSGEVVLYWSHHEKLCLVDNELAFMGGLDLCFGRWDTNSHPIADAHPGDLDAILFPGQDYNNARVYDFEDVDKWENNKLDRTKSSRMGWSDVSISLSGNVVASLASHFIDRWNFIYDHKYESRRDENYQRIELPSAPHRLPDYIPDSLVGSGQELYEGGQRLLDGMRHQLSHGLGRLMGSGDDSDKDDDGSARQDRHSHHHHHHGATNDSSLNIQITRSCTEWSGGHPTEHSVANAYIAAITNAEHFVYIENQFFITATSDAQHPVSNKIGRAIVDRVLRAHREGDSSFSVIVCIPAVPGFAGDLHAEGALGTRAIMEFQYNSISRGGHSIYEALRAGGVADPTQYVRFYNLRNYDRINTASGLMHRAEAASGVAYETARREFDDAVESGYDAYARDDDTTAARLGDNYRRYQAAAAETARKHPAAAAATRDSVSACYMLDGPALEETGWDAEADADAGPDADADELAAFVSEELYIHTKVLIADDRLVICGSANLNDRSQLGSHDSEIAAIIEDPAHPVQTTMGGKPYTVGAFPASLRRQLFRKHIGLLPDQRWDKPTANFLPVTAAPNDYDWNSPADRLVADPLSADFRRLWTSTAATNMAAFDDVFHCVPSNHVRNWDQYESYFFNHFISPGADTKKEAAKKGDNSKKALYGHVVPNFPGGARAVKARLGQIRGNLVEMPLDFLVEVEDLAKEGLALNSLTDELYT